MVVLVELDEGLRIVSNLRGPPADAAIDLAVEVVFEETDGVTLPQFVPATS